MAGKFTELAIDCAEPEALARFWCAVLDYEAEDHHTDPEVHAKSPPVPVGS